MSGTVGVATPLTGTGLSGKLFTVDGEVMDVNEVINVTDE